MSELSINTTKVCGLTLILSTNDKIGKVRVLHERAVWTLEAGVMSVYVSASSILQCHNIEREVTLATSEGPHTWLSPCTRHGGRVASGSAGVNIEYLLI